MVDKCGLGTGFSPSTAAFPGQYQYSTPLHSSFIDTVYSYSMTVLNNALKYVYFEALYKTIQSKSHNTENLNVILVLWTNYRHFIESSSTFLIQYKHPNLIDSLKRVHITTEFCVLSVLMEIWPPDTELHWISSQEQPTRGGLMTSNPSPRKSAC
jgi:hypothetical protein